MEYEINKGIGESVEFKGLKAQYVFILVLGVLANMFLFIILYSFDLALLLCVVVVATSTSLLVYLTYKLNDTYGQYGLMKRFAGMGHPYYLINRKPTYQLFKKQQP